MYIYKNIYIYIIYIHIYNILYSVANNVRSSAFVDRLRTLLGKRNIEITKMTDHFSHTQKGFYNCQT